MTKDEINKFLAVNVMVWHEGGGDAIAISRDDTVFLNKAWLDSSDGMVRHVSSWDPCGFIGDAMAVLVNMDCDFDIESYGSDSGEKIAQVRLFNWDKTRDIESRWSGVNDLPFNISEACALFVVKLNRAMVGG